MIPIADGEMQLDNVENPIEYEVCFNEDKMNIINVWTNDGRFARSQTYEIFNLNYHIFDEGCDADRIVEELRDEEKRQNYAVVVERKSTDDAEILTELNFNVKNRQTERTQTRT